MAAIYRRRGHAQLNSQALTQGCNKLLRLGLACHNSGMLWYAKVGVVRCKYIVYSFNSRIDVYELVFYLETQIVTRIDITRCLVMTHEAMKRKDASTASKTTRDRHKGVSMIETL